MTVTAEIQDNNKISQDAEDKSPLKGYRQNTVIESENRTRKCRLKRLLCPETFPESLELTLEWALGSGFLPPPPLTTLAL